MTRRLVALAALAALGHAVAASAVETLGLMPPNTPVTAPPPLPPGVPPATSTPPELHIPVGGHVRGAELVIAGLRADGVVARVRVTQRLVVTGTGDYAFTVPAPAESVIPGPGTESQPGLRDAGILWQGFSDRRRVLSATAALRPAAAAVGLPLRVRVEPRGATTVIRLTNLTHRRIPVLDGRPGRPALAGVLRKLRAAARPLIVLGGPWFLTARSVRSTKMDVTAPLHITGAIAGGSQRRPVDLVLGGGRPAERSIVVPGNASPVLRLRVGFVAPLEVLPTPGALARSRHPVMLLQHALGAIATSWSYRHYLGLPDATGTADTSFVYSTVRVTPRAAAALARGGSDTLAILLGTALGLVCLAGLAVLWARS